MSGETRISDEPQRIDQTLFGRNGNCQSACLAMLMGLRLEDVPNFSFFETDLESFHAQREWLNARGWNLVTVPYAAGFMRGYWIAGGPSARGLHHGVVYKDEELWHDPHPDRTGLLKVEEADLLYPLFASELLRELAATRREWQPIETAPSNERVLLYGPHGIELGFASHGWPRNAQGISNMSFHSTATHWMPLPAAPTP